MNINKNVENLEKRENYGHCKVLDGLQDLSCIPETNSHGCQRGHRDHLNAIQYYHQECTHLRICMILNFIVSTPIPSAV